MIRKKMSRKTKGMICCLALTALGSIILSEESQAVETNANADVKLKLPYRVPEVIENMEDIDNVGYDVNTTASSTNIHFFGQELEDNYNKYLMIPDFQFGNINYKGQAVTVPAKELEYKLNNGEVEKGVFSELVESEYPPGMFYVHASPFINENTKILKGASINIDYENYNVYRNELSQNIKLDTLTTEEKAIVFYPEISGGEAAGEAPEYEHSKFELNVQDLHVKLNIPANLSIDDNTTYTSTLTWTASEDPTPPTEIQYDGYWGTAPYTFDKDTGELVVYPGELADSYTINGENGTGGYIGTQFNVINDIKSVKFVGNVVAPEDSSQLFYGWQNMKSFDGTNLDTSKVTSMNVMFGSCQSLTSVDVSNWDTSNVADMSSMFYNCSSLTNLDVSKWNTANVTSMNDMFYNCSLTNLDVSKWNTANVTSMNDMFYNCQSLTSLDVSNWDTSNVTNMYGMFRNCISLTNLDVSNWDTANVADMGSMFSWCQSLTSLDVSNWDTSNVRNMNDMFRNTTKLDKLTLGETFKFNDDTSLSGTWKLENGDKTFTDDSQWLNYNGATDAGTYIKQ